MKKYTLFLLLLAGNVFAQNVVNGDEAPYNKFSISLLAPLQFNYNSTIELFQQKVIPNAIQLNMKVKQENVGAFAQVRFFSSRPSPFANKLLLQMKYTDSPNASAPLNDVPLGINPVLLVAQPGGLISVKQYKYLFDLKLNPPDSYEGLENQNFSIIYTISLL